VSGEPPETLTAWATLFDLLSRRAAIIEDIVGALTLEHGPESFTDLSWGISALRHQLRSLRRDLTTLLPVAESRTNSVDAFIKQAGPEAGERWQTIQALNNRVPSLSEVSELCDKAVVELAVLQAHVAEVKESSPAQTTTASELKELADRLGSSAGAAKSLLTRLRRLAHTCESVFHEMDFSFLLDKDRELFTIGYNVGELRADNSYYDLLATEARVASFIGIAKGDVPQEHWFRMGRQLTLVHRARALISWTGTMFEYLMPAARHAAVIHRRCWIKPIAQW